ncbi:MAG: GNAT family N-acetyltransferase [Methanobacteriales archaeon HGW-Methanobacteriales-2]|nr:MAG: GNAT family N-acetyltransferase [Methanobacteriales archaeon HGW-Methanobacteriales-2]
MIIEPASIEDALEILSLQKLCYQSEAKIYNDHNIHPLIQTLEEIKSEFGAYSFLKAVEDGRIIGSVRARMMTPETLYIGRLIVHPDFQNQGIGGKLMERIENKFPEAERSELITGHLSLKNIKFYEKRGFEIFKTKKITSNLNLLYLTKINKNKF